MGDRYDLRPDASRFRLSECCSRLSNLLGTGLSPVVHPNKWEAVSRSETAPAQSGVNQLLDANMEHTDHLDRLVFLTTLLSALIVHLPW